MKGEKIIVRSLNVAAVRDAHGNAWQYHSRSDRHSKIACWAIMFDLLGACPLLREHVTAGKVAFGINHELRDFKQDRKKNLDLVLSTQHDAKLMTFADYGRHCGVVLDGAEADALAALPVLRRASVSNVLVALEAKACMTEHQKAQPRLHDELASSHQTIHGDTGGAIAAGFVMINCADSFVSPDRNRKRVRNGKFVVNPHKQPAAAMNALNSVMKLPRRSEDRGDGFDAFGITMIRCANDGSPVAIDVQATAEIQISYRYDALIKRIAHLYGTRYPAI